MVAYTKDEIKAFVDKDLRISKLAITKSLIEKSEDIYAVQKITELAEKYIDYVYEERSAKRGSVNSVVDKAKPTEWEKVAVGLNLAIPNSQNIKMLNQLADEYKEAQKASDNPSEYNWSRSTILVHILNTFGQYPTKTESVKKIVESLNLKG